MPRCGRLLTIVLLATACSKPPLHPLVGVTIHPVEDNVSFLETDGHRITVDVYQPAIGGRNPAVILLHGSGGIHGPGTSTVNRYARTMAEQGMVAFVVHYFDGTGNYSTSDSAEAANYFHWVREVREAVTWIRTRSDVQVNSIGLLGHSLGAFLAVGVAAADVRINRIVLLGSALEPFLADSIKRMPPSLILHGAKDSTVPLSDAQHLADFLRARGFIYQMKVYPGEEHNFTDSAASDALTRAARFLAPPRRNARARD